MKPYTKTGDKGTTSLIGGKRVAKTDLHLEIYGTLDELSSFIGLLKQYTTPHNTTTLFNIQETLVHINALFANDSQVWDNQHPFSAEKISNLELEIDKIDQALPPINCFLIPGTCPCNALCNICRCICRRAERHIHQIELLPNQQIAAIYINRLSDYFFVLGRFYEQQIEK
jgi:cob(I)alamin adenosyltransferase